MTVGAALPASLVISPAWAAVGASGEEPCRIDADAAVIRLHPSKTAAQAAIAYRDRKCRFHGYTRDVVGAPITMTGSGVDRGVGRPLLSAAKEQPGPIGP
ncbi:hypothetical protein [Streptomyces sp. NPDC048361]|uniref:hypothetical protein n=1 Tax=Streptomyces sp. NPDC048361 TaxID=3154720 RepID=UPI00343A7B1D